MYHPILHSTVLTIPMTEKTIKMLGSSISDYSHFLVIKGNMAYSNVSCGTRGILVYVNKIRLLRTSDQYSTELLKTIKNQFVKEFIMNSPNGVNN